MGELADCILCLPTAAAQHYFPFPSFCRAVRGPLDHGDAQRAQQQRPGRSHRHLHHLCSICSADSGHPAGHGGALSLPTCPASALVCRVVLWSFSQISLGGNRLWEHVDTVLDTQCQCTGPLVAFGKWSEGDSSKESSEIPSLTCTLEQPACPPAPVVVVSMWDKWQPAVLSH